MAPTSASDRFRREGRLRTAVGLAASAAAHLLLLAALSGLRPSSPIVPVRETRLVELPPVEAPASPRPPRVEVPAPRASIQRPGPPVAVRTPGSLQAPEWTPHDVPPRLLNPSEVQAVLEERTLGLPAAEEERLVVLWLYVERSGEVTKLRLQRSSGLTVVDRAAREVADRMRFRPALFRGRRVPVWIAQPIRFFLRVANGAASSPGEGGR